MADFVAVCASNRPRPNDPEAVRKILAAYHVDSDLRLGVEPHAQSHAPQLFLYGYAWPEAWKLPTGVAAEDFNPFDDEYDELGAEGFAQLLRELALHLEEPLTVHAVGCIQCRFPLSACEWHIEPGATVVEINEFRYGSREPSLQVSLTERNRSIADTSPGDARDAG